MLPDVEASTDDLLAAESAGLVTLDGRPHFAHPLWVAAVLDFAGPVLRRRAHHALANHTSNPDRAVLHRASSTAQPDERVATEIDALAARCVGRGLPAMAAHAWMDAARLSETSDAQHRRELAAANAFWHASLPGVAAEILDRTIPALGDPRGRAEAVLLRNQIRAFTENARGAALELRAEADRLPATVADLEFPLVAAATIGALLAADLPLGLELSARAVVRASDEIERTAAHALRGGIADAVRRGFASIAAFSSALLAELEFRRGRWLDAVTDATVDVALTESHAENRAPLGHAVAAHVLAHLGDAAACESRARRAREFSDRHGLESIAAFAHCALGASALAQGDTAMAARELRSVWEIRLRGDVAEPGIVWYQGDFIEALIAEGRRDEAEEVVREVARNAKATGRGWSSAIGARGRALLGRGSVRDALAATTALGAPFELARTRLVLVEHERCDARAAGLDAALTTFERLGARPWATRARTALGAHGDSPASLAQQLTDAELRVAMLVGRGATNASVSEQLVISVRTVDAHLRTIFRKLGIQRRGELVLRVATEGGWEQGR